MKVLQPESAKILLNDSEFIRLSSFKFGGTKLFGSIPHTALVFVKPNSYRCISSLERRKQIVLSLLRSGSKFVLNLLRQRSAAAYIIANPKREKKPKGGGKGLVWFLTDNLIVERDPQDYEREGKRFSY